MKMGIEGDVARIQSALNTPTLKLLDRKSARIAMPLFANAFPEDGQPVPVEQFHSRIDALLDELRASGHQAPSLPGKTLSMQWVRERWLYRDPGDGEETYQLTGDAKQALDYVARATRNQVGVSVSRIETMRRVVSDAALAANPDREERKKRLREEIDRLQADYDLLDSGAEMAEASEAELHEQFLNVLRELDGLPSDFRRVEEAVRGMHRAVTQRLREEDRPIGEVVDNYLHQARTLLESTAEGRAFKGALELFRNPDWLARLRNDLAVILDHPRAATLPPEEQRQLRTTVDVIRRGMKDVLGQRQRLTATLNDHIRNYDHIRNRELDLVLRGIDTEMRAWMLSARPRDHVGVELVPPALDLELLRLRTFDPESERAPEPLEDVSDEAPGSMSLEEIRKQGGPSLARLRERIKRKAGEPGSVAQLFNELPTDLRRPVEILGLLQLYAQGNAEVDAVLRETVSAVRPDGTMRLFEIPVVIMPPPTDGGDRP